MIWLSSSCIYLKEQVDMNWWKDEKIMKKKKKLSAKLISSQTGKKIFMKIELSAASSYHQLFLSILIGGQANTN